MMRDSAGRASVATVFLLLLIPTIGCVGQQLELITPVPTDASQYKTDEFLVFFSPAIGEAGLEGLRLSLTNTAGNTLSIDWRASYFILPDGGRSDVITSDIPTSFQQSATQVSIRQTVEIVAIPLSSVSHSESGWAIGPIDIEDGSEFTLHLAVESAGGETVGEHDFTFRVVETAPMAEAGESAVAEARTAVRLPVWSALLALGIGFLLGLLLSAP